VLSRIHSRDGFIFDTAIALIVRPPMDMIALEEASGGTIAGMDSRRSR